MSDIIKTLFEKNKISWKKSFLDGFSQDENGNPVPWMTYEAIDFLKKNINKNHDIFEFGSGASTLFFSRMAGSITSLESNKRWFEIIADKSANMWSSLQKQPSPEGKYKAQLSDENNKEDIKNISIHNHHNCANINLYLMNDALTNDDYQNFPNILNKKFDFIIVDSLKRFECVRNCLTALKPSGCLILDDSERKNYKKIFDFLSEKNFKAQDFFGIAPAQLRIKNTTFFTQNNSLKK